MLSSYTFARNPLTEHSASKLSAHPMPLPYPFASRQRSGSWALRRPSHAMVVPIQRLSGNWALFNQAFRPYHIAIPIPRWPGNQALYDQAFRLSHAHPMPSPSTFTSHLAAKHSMTKRFAHITVLSCPCIGGLALEYFLTKHSAHLMPLSYPSAVNLVI